MESISRISSILETGTIYISKLSIQRSFVVARDLTLEAAQSVSTRATLKDVPFLQVKKLLDSRHDREILDGLRKVISVRVVNYFRCG